VAAGERLEQAGIAQLENRSEACRPRNPVAEGSPELMPAGGLPWAAAVEMVA